ncbi:aldehyde ferredoxin oxidoreductase family protein [Halanaerobium congolense]|uniref:Aldehyde:ferredoxin oxidoreductase n=1 Tax=Halanaerobium congolense TaxID=54121 RepID=A0A1G8I7W5_9FIRM|nr:aldehyde ferredoxin oxidoreductase family protein [Halanaerobium congolense]SDI15048.1 aldehyde:ferredoxin oxidoreductase [Halanaerobium congolense]SDK50354.1 aldehyde:ferredoxin oxidoreductase [Halanaerobium congolense]SDL83313.1 aldehyde:ferredoxin oxidoreductase [Halanaerobium congolense]SES75624.1 aldehyde:ferredoxin oxidoreductase [Halanaerobium congolense]
MGKIYEYKVLRVDLTNEEIKTEKIVGDDVKNYLGGRGLASKILYDEIDPKVDPLSPENKLIYATGLLTGTAASTGGRYMVVTKGPLTGTIASSNSGGFFGAELRFSGNDIIIFEGKAKRPLYLSIKGEEVELKDASNLWGKTVYETTDLLIEEAGDKNARVSCIGPAGENLVKFAAIMNEKDRAAGRTGVGAVMGSKNLKAVVVKADEKQVEYFKDEMMKVVRKQTKMLKEDGVTGEGLPALGTKVLDNIINSTGLYPVNNFQDGGTFADVDEVSGEALVEKGYLQSNKGCYGCPIRCARDTKLPNGQQGEGPEYESGWAFGADCGVNDLNAITEANFLCNDLGMDTITAGTTIACAMELYEKGYIDKDELENGPELKFGSSESIIYYTEKMAYRKGLGDKLAEGSYRLADSKGQPELSMSVKKQELPAYDPRGVQGQGLNYVTSNRGGCHVRGYMISPEVLGAPEKLDPQELEGKAGWVKTFQDLTAVIDSVGMCLFTSFALGLDDYREIVNAGTQFDYTSDSLLEAGERIYNLERQFNLEAGILPEQDKLPARFDEPLPDGPQKGISTKYREILPEYYEIRGWQEDGWISEQKLKDMKIK